MPRGAPANSDRVRHYDFSHLAYRDECRRIARLMGERYGREPAYRSLANRQRIRLPRHNAQLLRRCAQRLSGLARAEIPIDRCAEPGVGQCILVDGIRYIRPDRPAKPDGHRTQPSRINWRSGAIVPIKLLLSTKSKSMHCVQHTDAPLIHNYMGRITTFDHWKVGADLDIASWDSYPIGFLSDRLEGTRLQASLLAPRPS